MIRLFEIENGVVKPTEHCYTIKWLRVLMEEYPDPKEHINMYAYIYYMTCPSPDNPYFNLPEDVKEESIEEAIEINFSTEIASLIIALKKAEQLYETPTVRVFKGMKKMLDNLADYMGTTKIEHGRDGNISAIVQAAKNLGPVRESFKGVMADLEAEQNRDVRGGKSLAYDQ